LFDELGPRRYCAVEGARPDHSWRGKAPIVRIPPGRAIRSSERHQAEKDLALGPKAERATIGEAETNLGISIDQH
jgi:GntR family transcriptional regulator